MLNSYVNIIEYCLIQYLRFILFAMSYSAKKKINVHLRIEFAYTLTHMYLLNVRAHLMSAIEIYICHQSDLFNADNVHTTTTVYM